jgi:uncharacterized protein with PIN domain
MTKCNVCNNKIQELFLGKLKGTIIKNEGKSKKYNVCFECQKKFTHKELLEKV